MTRALVDIAIAHGEWRAALPRVRETCRRAARAALAVADDAPGECEVSLMLADDATLRQLNRDHRGVAKATNVLAFATQGMGQGAAKDAPQAPFGPPGGPLILGDVVLAFETVSGEADERGIPLGDHLAHLVVHGVLHLLGYDHETDADEKRMQRLEWRALGRLEIPDPTGGGGEILAAPGGAHLAPRR